MSDCGKTILVEYSNNEPCELTSLACTIYESAIPFLSLPENSTGEEIITAIVEVLNNSSGIGEGGGIPLSLTHSELNGTATLSEGVLTLPTAMAELEITLPQNRIFLFSIQVLDEDTGRTVTHKYITVQPEGVYQLQSILFNNSCTLVEVSGSSQFTPEQVEQLLELIYTVGTATLSVSPTTFERNLTNGVTVTFNWNIVANDDSINTATFDGNNVSANLISNQSFANVKNTLSKQLAVQFENSSDQSTSNENITRTATALIPQWKGQKANNTTLNGSSYVALSGAFTKIVQANSATSITVTAGNYGVFVSTNANATIIENGTGFALASSAYIKNTITVEYQDGTALTLTEYIINTAVAEFSYTIN